MKKRTLTVMLTATMLFTGASFAEEAVNINIDAPAAEAAVSLRNIKSMITVEEIGENYIIAKTDSDTRIQLNISEATCIIDSETGTAIDLTSIKAGDVLSAEYSSIMTRSIPAQTNAVVIASNVEKGGLVNFIEASSVSKTEDGNVVVTDKASGLILTIAKDASVTPYKTRNIVRLDDIAEGTRFIAWYDMETMSIPAQSSTKKIVILPELVEGAEDEAADEAIDEAFTVEDKLGYTEGIELAPDKKITRSDFAHIAYNMLNSVKPFTADATENLFNDTDKKEVNTLASIGIIAGKGEKLFAPEDLITREEAAVLLDRIAKYLGIDMSMAKIATGYSDIETVSPWALSAVQNLSASNIISSKGGAFNPKNDITAAEAVEMLGSMSDVFTGRK